MDTVSIVLNYKKIPFETEWLEYLEIESVLKSIDAKPTVTARTEICTPFPRSKTTQRV